LIATKIIIGICNLSKEAANATFSEEKPGIKKEIMDRENINITIVIIIVIITIIFKILLVMFHFSLEFLYSANTGIKVILSKPLIKDIINIGSAVAAMYMSIDLPAPKTLAIIKLLINPRIMPNVLNIVTITVDLTNCPMSLLICL
jgi:hypothetical protein